ncbi:MAG: hypothetical protein JW909_11030 [Planctomycetes bacterium]|nr:hypothetical protein [Planctomycetota bacterium]
MERTSRGDLAGALAAGEELFLATYVSMRVYMHTLTPFSAETPFLRGLLLMLVAIVVLRRALTVPRRTSDDAGLIFPLALYAVVLVASAMHSVHPSASWEKASFAFEVVLLVVAMYDGAYLVPGRRGRMAGVLVGAAAVVLIYGAHQKFWGLEDLASRILSGTVDSGNTFENPWAMRRLLAKRPFGAFITSNILGGYLVLVVPLIGMTAYAALKKGRWALGMVPAAVAVAGLVTIAWTGSKGAAAAVVCSAGILLLTLKKRAFWPVFFWGAWGAAGAGAFLLAALSSPWSSMGIRWGYWLGGLKALWHHPMGFGPGSFDVIYTLYRPVWAMEARTPHNACMEALFGGGIVLLTVFVFMLYRHLKAALPVDADGEPSGEEEPRRIVPLMHYMGMFLGVLMTGVVFHGLTYENLQLYLYAGESNASAVMGAISFPVMLAAAPLTAWLVNRTASNAACRPYLKVGFIAGLLGLMVHSWVDFLWHTEGIVVTLAAGAWAVSGKKEHSGEPAPAYGGNTFTPGRITVMAFSGMVVSAAFVFLCVRPLDGALALRRMELVLAPRMREVGSDLNAISHTTDLVASGKTTDAAAFFEKHRFSAGVFREETSGGILEKEAVAVTLKAGRTGMLEPPARRLEHVRAVYEEEFERTSSRFIMRYRGDDRALYQAAVMRRNLAAANAASPAQIGRVVELMDAALRSAPTAAAYWTVAGETAMDRMDYDDATRKLYTAAYYYPASPVRWLAAGDAALLAGQYMYAGRFYRKALELNALTIEEQASLYTAAAFPGIIHRRRPEVEAELSAALRASLEVAVDNPGGPLKPDAFLFRVALVELSRGSAGEAAESFRVLRKACGENLAESLAIFIWGALMKTPGTPAAELEELKASVTTDSGRFHLKRLRHAFELAKPRI